MRTTLALLIAIVLGIVAVVGIRSYVKRRDEARERQLRPVRVLAAKRYIAKGEPLVPDMWKAVPIPEASITKDNILPRDEMMIVQQTVNDNIERDEQLRWSSIRTQERQLGERLLQGEVAMTIPVDAVAGVGGNLRPGSHVDILATLPPTAGKEGAARGTMVIRLMTDVRIMAVDNRTSQEQVSYGGPSARRGRYSTITLALTPDETTLIAGAKAVGELTLVLRNASDELTSEPPEITAANLIEEAKRLNEQRKTRKAEPVGVIP